MIGGLPAEALLELSSEPVLVVDSDRIVRAANRPARVLLGQDIVGSDLADCCGEDRDRLSGLLERATRSTGPIPGALWLKENGASVSRRVAVRRICREQPYVALAFRAIEDDRFTALNERIGDLDAEIRERSRTQASLEEALAQNQLLLQELQHRVKNTVQMLVGLLQGPTTQRGERSYAELVAVATQRLLAVSRAHELMYRQGDFHTVPAGPFLASLVELLSGAFGSTTPIELVVRDEWQIPHDEAMAISLIVNELVTNAKKHGGPEALVSISLERDSSSRRLTIRDRGPGIPESAPEDSFGLKLVRGLCRQIGGRLDMHNDGGAVCVIHMRVNDGGQP